MTAGLAMQMKLDLARLAVTHGIATKPVTVPLSAPTDGPMTLTGLASTIDVDLTRQKFRGWAFDNPCLLLKGHPRPPLLYKHDPEQIAGTITHLVYDDRGQLRISADVSHERALAAVRSRFARLCSNTRSVMQRARTILR